MKNKTKEVKAGWEIEFEEKFTAFGNVYADMQELKDFIKKNFVAKSVLKKSPPKDYVFGEGNYCDVCFGKNIDFGRGYRICKDCKCSINTSRVVWG